MEKDEQLVRNALEEALSQLDAVRLGGLVEVKDLQLGFHALLEQEVVRQADKFGFDHPRATAIREILDVQRSFIRELQVKVETAVIRLPQVREEEVLLHGRVVDSGRRGFFGLIVYLLDKSGTAVPDVDPATTDESGYYSIRLPTKEAETTTFLEVSSPKGMHLFRSTRPVKLAAEILVRMDVTLHRSDLFQSREPRPKTETARRSRAKTVPSKKKTRRKAKSTRESAKGATRRGED